MNKKSGNQAPRIESLLKRVESAAHPEKSRKAQAWMAESIGGQ